MIKCPFCGFDNEEGALFCEQCKSDLSSVGPAAAPPPPPPADVIPVAPLADEVPMAAVVEALPADMPMAAVVEEAPLAEPIPFAPQPIPFAPEPVAAPEPPMAEIPVAPVAPEPPAVPVGQTPPVPPPVEAPPLAEPPPSAPAPPPAAPAAPAAASKAIPAGAELKLLVIRGQRINAEFPVYAGQNFIGRADEKPVDIDLEDQEPPDRVWTSRQHALLEWDDASGTLTLEDLNSSNGTYINRVKAYPGQKQQLYLGDVIQIGNIHLRVKTV